MTGEMLGEFILAVSMWCRHSQQDNVAFHSVVFPATLLGTGEKWTKVKMTV